MEKMDGNSSGEQYAKVDLVTVYKLPYAKL